MYSSESILHNSTDTIMNETHGEKVNMLNPDSLNFPLLSVISPLISTSCSSDKGCPFIGSVPFSAMYFSMSLRSNTWLDTGETQGCSGTSFETAITNTGAVLKSHISNNTTNSAFGGFSSATCGRRQCVAASIS